MPLHKRLWGIGKVDSLEELADKLTESTWCLCNGFFLPIEESRGLAFLNDATCEDGAAEYAIMLAADGLDFGTQVESFTVSWMSRKGFIDATEQLIKDIRHDRHETYGTSHGIMEWDHKTCRFCA
jgi:hypothetical protein